MKHLRFALFVVALLFGVSSNLLAQLTGLHVEPVTTHDGTVGSSDLTGHTTYRVYATLTSPADLIQAAYGSAEAPLNVSTTTDFWQTPATSVEFGTSVNPAFFSAFPELAYDSWFTIGLESIPSQGPAGSEQIGSIGMDTELGMFEAGANFLLNSDVGGSYYALPGATNGIAGDDLEVLLGQFTTSGLLSGAFNLLVYVEGDDSNEQPVSYSFEAETLLSACVDELACNYDGSEPLIIDNSTCLYPEEGYDCSGICLSDYDGDGICNEFEVEGCTFSLACNYNPEATDDDGSCEFYCPGCTDEAACNYDVGAIQEDGSCQYPADLHGVDYVDCNGVCITDTDFDGVCDEEETFGCTDESACNFLAEATQDDGGCLIPNPASCEVCVGELVVAADSDGDGVCDSDEVAGCTDEVACNFDPASTDDDGSCSYPVDICGESYFDCSCECLNDADGDGVCDEAEIAGCQDPIACNFNAEATDPAPCETTSCAGCIYPFACNYDPDANYSDGSCEFGTCAGCTDPAACNFNPTVSDDDGTCAYLDECGVCGGEGPADGFYCDGTCVDSDGDGVCDVDEAGCMDEAACNYNAFVNEDDGSCTYADDCIDCDEECFDLNENQICDCEEILGCLDETACNYDPLANIDSGACFYPEPNLDCNGNCLNDADEDGVCDEQDSCPFDPQNDIDGDGICAPDEIEGCTDQTACNYNAVATDDDGSCILVEAEVDSAYNQGFSDGMVAGVESIVAEEFCGEGTIWDSGFELCIPSYCFGDFNDDGERGTEDLLQLLAVFGTPCPSEEMPFACGDAVSFDNYDYETVQIGPQCWFAENLRTEHYANGDAIPGNLSVSGWTSTSSGAQTVYGEGSSSCYGECDEVANLEAYGRLYNWYAVDDSRGLCPSGWHVPTDGEWTELTDFLGGSSVAGTALKSSPSDEPSWNGTNTSGFSALPGGGREGYYGDFIAEGNNSFWWSASLNGTSYAWYRFLFFDSDDVYRFSDGYSLRNGFSVRCLRDE